jgi:hypothetical protein
VKTSVLSVAALALIYSMVSASPSALAVISGCTAGEIRDGTCSVDVGGSVRNDTVVLDGSQTAPGSLPPPPAGPQAPRGPTRPPVLGWNVLLDGCIIGASREECIRQAEAAGVPPISIRDIAAFVPTPGRQQMEPDGWTVAGLDTNFYAITEPHVVPGTLLGRPAEVRFTPDAFRWAYGDGASATLATKGGTWAALGIAEFEATPTSHVYEQLGEYTITLAITFTAEYRFDGGAWIPVVGQLTLPANDLDLRVGTAKTVLVERDCLVDPTGPGC